MNQRGFLSGAALYAVLGLGAATLLAGGWGWIQGQRLEAAQEQLEACKVVNNQLNGQIKRQNEAVDALERASAQAKERSRRAVIAANASAGASTAEIERLKASKPTGGPCPAGDAVKQVRIGLGESGASRSTR